MHITDKLNICHVHVVFRLEFSLVFSLSVIIKSYSMKYCGYTSFCAMFQARMFNTNFNVRISGEEKSNTKKMCASVALIFQCGRNNKILYVEMSDL